MGIRQDREGERAAMDSSAAGRERLIVESFARVTDGRLTPAGEDAAGALWSLPAAVVAHGTEDDPLFFYANRAALALFEARAADFIGMPSRLSAPPADREERARFMARVAAGGFVDDYAGIRVSTTGRRFRIRGATVWNLLDARGACHGQAAHIRHWSAVD